MPTIRSGRNPRRRPRRANRLADRLHEALDIVGRILPGEMRVFRIEQNAVFAVGIVEHATRHFGPVVQIDDQRPDAVCAIVNAQRKAAF